MFRGFRKFLLIFFCCGFYSQAVFAQEVSVRKANLEVGIPDELAIIKKQMGLKDLSYTSLETGNDSIGVKFGKMSQNGTQGHWVSIYRNGEILAWETISLGSAKSVGDSLELLFDDSSKMISFCLRFTSDTEIAYQWLYKGKASNLAQVERMERLLATGKEMPLFTAQTLDGEEIQLSDYKDHYLVINWWATTCSPCLAEMPGLNELVKEYESNDNVQFLAIAWDEREKVMSFLSKRDFTYRQSLGNQNAEGIFGNSFPKHIIVDREGMISYYNEGGSSSIHESIGAHLEKLLAMDKE